MSDSESDFDEDFSSRQSTIDSSNDEGEGICAGQMELSKKLPNSTWSDHIDIPEISGIYNIIFMK